MTWKMRLCDALEHLGGEAHLKDIYKYIENHYGNDLTVTWQATVRGTLERASSDSKAYDNKDDLFYSVSGLGEGIWGLKNFEPNEDNMDITQDDSSFSEGRETIRKHIIRERNHQLISKAKNEYLKKNGVLKCEICGFDFEKVYGKIGYGFIEAHHLKPVSMMKEGEKTRVEDIVLLCSNCHSMVHRKKPWLSKEELSSLIK